jgi:hypothetical protein
MMKRLGIYSVVVAALTIAFVAPVRADEIALGDSEQTVRDRLGAPSGYIGSGSYLLLIYDRGKVEFKDGEVASFDLVSAEEARERKVQREQRRKELAEKREAQRVSRQAEAVALKEKTLSDPVFIASSVDKQLEFWRSFRRRYPNVPVDAEYAEALAQRKEQQEELAAQERLLDMEKRVALAEAEAEEARRDADEARRSRRYVYPTTPHIGYYDYHSAPSIRIRPGPSISYIHPPHYSVPCRRPHVWQPDYPAHHLKNDIHRSRGMRGGHVGIQVGP